ncbi:hypothetical protein PVL29_006413 [Vitis rotundifolia]|uniref:Uncharacterized protein n=1 Tax=Vitis rotundifolia TaxID=103349 RepID=A0AA39DX27_VITRO|nr:hypothetical protein PVL29_006413 [Vitis rotundifolia]
MCVQIFGTLNGTSLLSYLLLRNLLLLRQWHLKILKLHMSTRVMIRLSLLKQHIVPLWAPRLVAKRNQLLHLR